MNVFDWLSALPLHDSAKPYPIIEVTFNKGSRKEFYRSNNAHTLDKGEWIVVEGVSGFDLGQVSLTGELVKLQLKKYNVAENSVEKRLLRVASEDDMSMWHKSKEREPEILIRSRAIARHLKLEMKLAEVELQADGRKATFFYTADQRVDFRELIKLYAGEFRVKVEMRQIGARQESAKVGGIGSCGRELCCSTWLTDFKSVNTSAARYQNLSINQAKLSGQCGRLKCCLNYELDTYMDALRVFPDNADTIETLKGTASLQKRDIFKNLMWYSFSDSNKQYPLTIARVKEILSQNHKGIKPDELQPVELETVSGTGGVKENVKVDMGFVNDVGQISLRSLEKGSRKKGGRGNRPQGGGDKGNRPQRPDRQKGDNQQQRPNRQNKGGEGQQKGGNQPQQQRRERPQGGDNQQKGNQPQQQRRSDRPQQQGGEGQQNRPQQQRRNRPRPADKPNDNK